MAKIILKDRLGNIFFQYAFGRKFSLLHDCELSLCLNNYGRYGRRAFNKQTIRTMIEKYSFKAGFIGDFQPIEKRVKGYNIEFYSASLPVVNEKQWGFNGNFLLESKNSIFNGYFHSELYFKDITEIIKQDLTLKKPVVNDVYLEYLDDIDNSNSVSVHVRRGDYLTSGLHNVCKMSYYEHAVAYVSQCLRDPKFYVFSDDIGWCKQNFDRPNFKVIDLNELNDDPTVNLELMARCKHNIISNSSFSWWAAWLNPNDGKKVICPDTWFSDRTMNEQALLYTIPKEWEKIPVSRKARS